VIAIRFHSPIRHSSLFFHATEKLKKGERGENRSNVCAEKSEQGSSSRRYYATRSRKEQFDCAIINVTASSPICHCNYPTRAIPVIRLSMSFNPARVPRCKVAKKTRDFTNFANSRLSPNRHGRIALHSLRRHIRVCELLDRSWESRDRAVYERGARERVHPQLLIIPCSLNRNLRRNREPARERTSNIKRERWMQKRICTPREAALVASVSDRARLFSRDHRIASRNLSFFVHQRSPREIKYLDPRGCKGLAAPELVGYEQTEEKAYSDMPFCVRHEPGKCSLIARTRHAALDNWTSARNERGSPRLKINRAIYFTRSIPQMKIYLEHACYCYYHHPSLAAWSRDSSICRKARRIRRRVSRNHGASCPLLEEGGGD